MFLVLKEEAKHSIKYLNDTIMINVKDFNTVINKEPKDIIMDIMKEDEMFKLITFPKEVFNLIIEGVVSEVDDDAIIKELSNLSLPLYSLIINLFSSYKKKYQVFCRLKESSCVTIRCTRNNILKGLSIAKDFKGGAIIDCSDISLEEYQNLLSSYDLNSIINYNIKINYQEHNSPISISELYDLSSLVCDISKTIKKYNLSPIEQVMYVYDLIKKREYKDDESDQKNSRDLDKVILSDTMVCAGYSNLLNAILRCLSFNAEALISYDRRHQRSIVYIEDKKYNIDGLYVFDPTWDRRQNKLDTDYINNYNYFALPIKEANKSANAEVTEILNYSFKEMLNIVNDEKSDTEKSITLLEALSNFHKILNFKNSEKYKDNILSYDFLSPEARYFTKKIYKEISLKSNSQEISPETFLKILYNVRRVEYYNDIVKELSSSEIRDVTIEKYITAFEKKLKEQKVSGEKRLISTLKIRFDLDDRLEDETKIIEDTLENNLSVKRDIKNIEVTKTLKKILLKNKK